MVHQPSYFTIYTHLTALLLPPLPLLALPYFEEGGARSCFAYILARLLPRFLPQL